jgi:hypothetical protein
MEHGASEPELPDTRLEPEPARSNGDAPRLVSADGGPRTVSTATRISTQ